VREVLKQYRPEIIRFFILSSHYRSPLNYSDEQLDDAGAALTRLYTALRGIEIYDAAIDQEYQQRFEQAMDDDFNTPVALAVLFELARELNKTKANQPEIAKKLAFILKKLGGLLGILQHDAEDYLKGTIQGAMNVSEEGDAFSAEGIVHDSDSIDSQVKLRLEAKKSKNWTLADKIRDDLKQLGIVLEDRPDGTTDWRREN
jgi:cysteinyl-tRNA synthetase